MPQPGGNLQALAAAEQGGGAGLIVFALDAAGTIWANGQQGAGGAFGGWNGPKFQNQPTQAAAIAAAGQNNGSLMLVMLDQQGMTWTLSQQGGGWGDWEGPGVGGQVFSWQSLSAAQQSGNRGIEIWVTDFDGQISTLYQTTPGGEWSSWEGPGFKGQTGTFDATAAAGQNNGNVMLFALDLDDSVWAIGQQWAGGDWGGWSGPNLAGQPGPFQSVAAAEQSGNRGVELWVVDQGGNITTLYQTTAGGEWSSWEGPGFKNQPQPFLRVAAAGQGNGNVLLLAAAKDGSLWYIGQQSPGGDWGAWESVPGPGS
ncbi:MAG TPA: hypothetical protein VF727_10405 [Allosphingosinicella sp.]|jgi:hypothetical protein